MGKIGCLPNENIEMISVSLDVVESRTDSIKDLYNSLIS